MLPYRALHALLLLLATGCANAPRPYSLTCAETPAPELDLSGIDGRARVRLDVLTYNIEGLSWPVRSGRSKSLQAIARHLAQLRAKSAAPDVVMFQEMFSRAAAASVVEANYPALAAGPTRTQSRLLPEQGSVPGRRAWKKGEIGIHYATGGLAIASLYPIEFQAAEPFSRNSCAGFDCLSNKGVLFARILIPGVPDPIDLFNTHMNSQRASKASVERRDTAHAVQARELASFIDAIGRPDHPTILAGDFNMRGSDTRFRSFRPMPRLSLVHSHCMEPGTDCEVRMSWDGDEPWMDTQDLQYFASGSRVLVRPLRVEAMFDGRPQSPALSDHDGFRVIYELSWPASATPAARCRAAGPQPLGRATGR